MVTQRPRKLKAQGLYSPDLEHDACGVGFMCSLNGEKSNRIILEGLEILVNLTHRGACGCDEKTGDGAGLLIQLPDKFLRKKAGELGIHLPEPEEYGVGMIFLPSDPKQEEFCRDRIAAVISAEGLEVLGWREPELRNGGIGEVARSVEPVIRQVFIGRGRGLADQAAFERKLYVVRKVLENEMRNSDLPQKDSFYIPSMSSKTLNYKGLLLADQIEEYFQDLKDPDMESGLILVHQRYSTNTFPTWDLAQPFRFLCHNGEINTLRGNVNWMNAREGLFESPLFGEDMAKLFPTLTPGASDSAILDNAIELLYHTGRSLPHCIMMMIPEAWQKHQTMDADRKAFYEYHSCLMEPWDGPASIPFTDGNCIGAVLDRNGLRPSRYTVTKDGFVIMASETGVVDIDPANVEYKGRLQPGRLFLVDFEKGRIVDDEEVKSEMAGSHPYRTWLDMHLIDLKSQPTPNGSVHPTDFATLLTRQQLFGYSLEDLNILLSPMASAGKEALGSMGTDTPMAVLSDRPQLLYNYFKQWFAQVTNPPLDSIREELVTSMLTNIGSEQDLFKETAEHCHQVKLEQPILTNENLERLRGIDAGSIRSVTLPMLYPADGDGAALKAALDDLCEAASAAVLDGAAILILSDRGAGAEQSPIPALLASAGVHHHLIRERLRTRCGIVVESAEPREVQHFCLLFGYGAGAVNPYLAIETLEDMLREGALNGVDLETAIKNYIKAANAGVLKVMSKMGISTLHSYRGAQIFEAVGLNDELVDAYFTGTSSRIGGIGLDGVAEEVRRRALRAYPSADIAEKLELDAGGVYQWRRNGEKHLFNPLTVAKLQQATRSDSAQTFKEYSELINDQSRKMCTLRGLFDLKAPAPIPIDEVEAWTEIVTRFKSGAMSFGSISREAHETLAIAMNTIGGKSNSGEGGEEPGRLGTIRNSAIKQVASGRFGVNSNYLINASELQIKMAQGAKPGEGGQLPANKVWPWIAKVRHSTPYVGLISPPPHHDIYSIEDLAQLIHDLKNANRDARINVKLVACVGVGTVAAGVSKGKADVVLISGWDGGTGASPETSLKHAGIPWELGLSDTHQTLVLNDLRSRIVVECDGQLKTGRDAVIACLLGAEEFGFATAALVSAGCIMMRVCHLDTCPVGVATQNPELTKRYTGKPEHVINFMRFIAEEMREIMASLGFRTINEMVGRSDMIEMRPAVDHWKARGLDFSKILYRPDVPDSVGVYCSQAQDHGLDKALDHRLLELAAPALERKERVDIEMPIRNINRTVGTILSSEISKRYGEDGLPDDTINIHFNGSAGQSFCAFGARGITIDIRGDANDYFCKGLSGAHVRIAPPESATFVAEENIIIGNVALYGATAGEMYARGIGGERFCVRNSGARTVIEGVGDHGCEYMTGGRVVVLGSTGRNFGAGMSGGIAYVLDEVGDFAKYRCNMEMVELGPVDRAEDIAELRELIEAHLTHTGSAVAQRVLDTWETTLATFIRVMPIEYRLALERMAEEAAAEKETADTVA